MFVEANMRVTNGIPLACLLLLPIGTVHSVPNTEGLHSSGVCEMCGTIPSPSSIVVTIPSPSSVVVALASTDHDHLSLGANCCASVEEPVELPLAVSSPPSRVAFDVGGAEAGVADGGDVGRCVDEHVEDEEDEVPFWADELEDPASKKGASAAHFRSTGAARSTSTPKGVDVVVPKAGNALLFGAGRGRGRGRNNGSSSGCSTGNVIGDSGSVRQSEFTSPLPVSMPESAAPTLAIASWNNADADAAVAGGDDSTRVGVGWNVRFARDSEASEVPGGTGVGVEEYIKWQRSVSIVPQVAALIELGFSQGLARYSLLINIRVFCSRVTFVPLTAGFTLSP
jgi:hypothetical protein